MAVVETVPYVVRDPIAPSPAGAVLLLVEDDQLVRDVAQPLLDSEGLVVSTPAEKNQQRVTGPSGTRLNRSSWPLGSVSLAGRRSFEPGVPIGAV